MGTKPFEGKNEKPNAICTYFAPFVFLKNKSVKKTFSIVQIKIIINSFPWTRNAECTTDVLKYDLVILILTIT